MAWNGMGRMVSKVTIQLSSILQYSMKSCSSFHAEVQTFVRDMTGTGMYSSSIKKSCAGFQAVAL